MKDSICNYCPITDRIKNNCNEGNTVESHTMKQETACAVLHLIHEVSPDTAPSGFTPKEFDSFYYEYLVPVLLKGQSILRDIRS